MEILLAKSAGFCFGVQRAVDTAYKHADEKNVYTYGQIIHNEEVVGDLAKHGVKILEDDELDQIKDSKVIIRSHGAEKRVYDILEKNGNEIIDATCPFVKKIHNIVMDECGKGHTVIIIGDGKHPEVKGIMGWCMSEPVVIGTEEEAEKFVQSCLNGEYKPSENISIVSQTTFNYRKFHNVVDIIRNKLYNVTAYKTICNATSVRQREAQEIASKVDAMIVIGGRNSSNTQKLYEISKKECENTYYIQTLVDLDLTTFESVSRVGITAGASTPNKLIKEVHGRMDEMNFAELLENDESRGSIKTGEIVEGRVIDVKPDEIIVDISYKSDGVIPRNEYTNTPNADLTELVHVGDAITAKVVKTNDGEGSVLLSYKRVAAEKANEKLEAALESGEILTGKVVQVVSGGLNVMYDETRVFIPASLVSDTYEKNLDKYLDQDVEFILTEYQPKKRRIIGNRKQIIVARKAEAAKELFDRIEVGMTVEGVVKNVTSFGAFIDLGGADGLLHISEMSWGRVEDPKSVLKVGDKVKAFIKNIDGEKIALSLKFDDTNPWLNADEKYAPGTVVTGKVARMADFGAFIELEPGVDALLHVSQISYDHVNKPEDVYKVGDVVEAEVVECNAADKKISLSVKSLLPVPSESDDADDAESEE
ncbi:bifunctional 4-hydroxy-3-methylbut-2-enyl diphosphate reductase/30S ribosomal protein S1 [Coprococcus eutactus]|jgi:(E)-4-hydroxy-3-methyl-but-2-enyl pyrophosphate reductase|uniref:4-hydroxy-3-methylbut-2-enyl diphosphate reductase n=1 Tax=Coprococcus eutactus TaxID=33043 RepID=A0A412ITF6_9FIRM|nr:bifunctional 4-hydroxy-3-methylbut-2-enyl diphosphate reductase/30S ribosomal protein S1 [Coprococcus eutactus]RGS43380.1 bifunctional 4-hydroxy-3-methylbut-2-enyl diphosphate reductase/30S ribosomal protein S1 [Coprococcus eutactus]